MRPWRPVLFAVVFLLALGLAPKASASGSGAFGPTGSMSVPRFDAAAAPLPEGRVLIAGGIGGGDPFRFPEYLQSAEVFDPATNSFSSAGIGSMTTARWLAAAAPLPDGRVLVVGGSYSAAALSSAEVFNPATNSFSSAGIGSMSVPLISPAAAPLPDGRVLVAGGSTGGRGPIHLSSAEVFDPATNTFSSAGIGSMSVPRTAAAAAPLPDGRVLVAGGLYYDGTSQILSSAEIFAPAICGDKQATIVGTEGIDYTTGRADDITGTRGSDVIVGLSGNDKLNGLAGNDLICGGAGKDTLNGGKGNDRLYGEAGNDTLKGGPGKDILKGGARKDKQVQ
jgi:Ca2+-binding RTX toxin-like protein